MEEALDALEARGIHLDTLRIRAFPFHDDVFDFISNSRARLCRRAEPRRADAHLADRPSCEIDPARLVPILHYDGTPITARFIVKAIADMLSVVTLAPLRKALAVNMRFTAEACAKVRRGREGLAATSTRLRVLSGRVISS